MASEDALTDFIQTLSNLPSEVSHILAEIDHKDQKVADLMGRVARREGDIQKHHKTQGLTVENPKEPDSVQKCRGDFGRVDSITDDKIALAERGARLLQRHLAKLQIELGKLQGEPVPNIAARFGLRISQEQMSQSSFSPVAIPGAPLIEPPNKRRKLGVDTGSASRSGSPALQSALARASPANVPATSSSLAPQSATGRKRKAPAPVEEDDDAEGEEDASGSEDNEADYMDQEGDAEGQEGGDDEVFCLCRKVSYGEMVGCDNAACQYEWFHLPCVGLKEPPKGKWYCPECSSGQPARIPPPPPSAASRGRGRR